MKAIVSILVALFFFSIASAEELYNIEKTMPLTWSDIEVADSDFTDAEQKVVIITNRKYHNENSGVIFPNQYCHTKGIKYIVAFLKEEKWYLKMYQNLASAVKVANDGRDFVYFVHGNGKTFTEALQRSGEIGKRYNVNIIAFDWPSEYNMLTKSQKIARKSARHFYQASEELKLVKQSQFQEGQNLTLFMHSLGNYLLAKNIAEDRVDAYAGNVYVNVIFNAAAIRIRGHDHLLERLSVHTNVYVLRNVNDFALRIVKAITLTPMLGASNKEPYADKVTYIQFGDYTGSDHTYFLGFHDYEHSNQNFYRIYNSLLHGDSISENDGYLLKTATQLELYLQ